MGVGLFSIIIGIVLIYVGISKKGGLVADFAVKLFSSDENANQPPTQ